MSRGVKDYKRRAIQGHEKYADIFGIFIQFSTLGFCIQSQAGFQDFIGIPSELYEIPVGGEHLGPGIELMYAYIIFHLHA